ncbi:hypothetical protein IWX48DRAFT_593300 [Phyllosticta citricarpa]
MTAVPGKKSKVFTDQYSTPQPRHFFWKPSSGQGHPPSHHRLHPARRTTPAWARARINYQVVREQDSRAQGTSTAGGRRPLKSRQERKDQQQSVSEPTNNGSVIMDGFEGPGGWVQQQQQQQQQQIGAYVPARTLLGVGACRRRLSTDDNDDCYSVLGCREGLVTRAIGKYDVRQAGREEQAPDASHGRVSSTGHDRCRSVDDGWPPSTPRWSKATHASSWASTRERASFLRASWLAG